MIQISIPTQAPSFTAELSSASESTLSQESNAVESVSVDSLAPLKAHSEKRNGVFAKLLESLTAKVKADPDSADFNPMEFSPDDAVQDNSGISEGELIPFRAELKAQNPGMGQGIFNDEEAVPAELYSGVVSAFLGSTEVNPVQAGTEESLQIRKGRENFRQEMNLKEDGVSDPAVGR